jgi:hypothetical protein
VEHRRVGLERALRVDDRLERLVLGFDQLAGILCRVPRCGDGGGDRRRGVRRP